MSKKTTQEPNGQLPDETEEASSGLKLGVEQPVPAALLPTTENEAEGAARELDAAPVTYSKGQVLKADSGREYKVIEVHPDFIRLRHEAGEINARREDIPGMLAAGAKKHDEALDLLDSTDDPLIAALQRQLAEAIAENNRLRAENADLRAQANDQEGCAADYRALLDEADAALDTTGYPIVSKTEIAMDIEQRTADALIERYKSEDWWREESAFIWRIDPKHPNGGSIAHVIRFERERNHKAGRSLVREAAISVGSQPTEPVLIPVAGV